MSAILQAETAVDLFGANPALDACFRPAGYKDIQSLGSALKRSTKDLIVMARTNDPFYCGSPINHINAEWFVECWNLLNLDFVTTIHARSMH